MKTAADRLRAYEEANKRWPLPISGTEEPTMDFSRRTREDRHFMRPLISDLTKPMLIDALRQVQHFLPPRPTRQDKVTLLRAVYAALNSDRYREQMQAALKAARNA